MATKKKAKRTTKPAAKSPKDKKPNTKMPVKKKLGQLDAVIRVLQQAKQPLNCKAMAKKKLWQSPAGRTPDATLYAAILRQISQKGKDARFKRIDRGLFALKAK